MQGDPGPPGEDLPAVPVRTSFSNVFDKFYMKCFYKGSTGTERCPRETGKFTHCILVSVGIILHCRVVMEILQRRDYPDQREDK